MTHNQINYWNMKETGRHNVATEVETNRHNVATEQIDLGKLQETSRHNLATEGETNRHNLVTEGQTNVNLGYTGATLDEMKRHNQALESLQNVDLNIKQGQLDENVRHNVSQEGINRYSAISQAELNDARAGLLDVQKTWEGLKNSVHVDLTSAQIQQLDNLSSKLQREWEKIEQETVNQKFENAFYLYEEFINGLNAYSRAVDALIPG